MPDFCERGFVGHKCPTYGSQLLSKPNPKQKRSLKTV